MGHRLWASSAVADLLHLTRIEVTRLMVTNSKSLDSAARKGSADRRRWPRTNSSRHDMTLLPSSSDDVHLNLRSSCDASATISANGASGRAVLASSPAEALIRSS